MIDKTVEQLLLKDKEKLYIPADKVAMVQDDHTLDHALLVLSNMTYSVIPVLNRQSQLVGLVSIPLVIKHVMSIEHIHFDQLHKFKVADVMDTRVHTITMQSSIEEILNMLVDANFLCVVDEKQQFQGIVTRKELLKRINYLVHELEIPTDHLASSL